MTNNTQAIPSSNAIVSFAFEDHEVRGFEYAGEPYFVGNEVAAALGYASPKDAVSAHCKALKLLKSGELALLGIPCGPRGMNIIPERDVYRLVMRSNLPTAEAFEEKVVGEILPAIRKTGSYRAGNDPIDPMAFLNDPAAMRAALLGYTEKVIALESVNAELAPKAAAHDRFSVAAGEYGLQETAKIIQVKPKVFMDWLDAHRCRYSRGAVKLAYQDKIDAGYFRNRATYYTDKNGEPQAGNTIRVTPKGLTWLAKVVPGAKIDPDYTVSIKEGETPVPFSRPKEAAS